MSINVSLTNPRHIAAANAAWKLVVEGETVEEFVQLTLERKADEWAERTKVDVISVADFILRFTGSEYSAITGSADPNVIGILATLRVRADVRLGSQDAINGVAYLVGAGFLTAGRSAEVLAY